VAFWDASAIVPLYCSQAAATGHGRKLLRDMRRMVVWWGRSVEARSAFARLVREGHLSDAQRRTAIRLLGQLRGSWDEIQPSEKVRSLAEGPSGSVRRSCCGRPAARRSPPLVW
jgi:hypothetical protein